MNRIGTAVSDHRLADSQSKSLSVLIGDDPTSGISDLFSELMVEAMPPGCRTEVITLMKVSDIVACVESRSFDLCLIMLNNVQVDPVSAAIADRIGPVTRLIADLRRIRCIPVIAFSGVPAMISAAQRAGADHCLRLPFDIHETLGAVAECLGVDAAGPMI